MSRLLSRLQHNGLIDVRMKHVRILDGAGLRAIAGKTPGVRRSAVAGRLAARP